MQMEQETMQKLLAEIAKRCPGGHLPNDYLVYDTETSGTDPSKDRILQHGFCIVRDRKRVDSFSQLVRHEGLIIPAGATKVHGITTERMNKEGMPAAEFLPYLADTLRAYREAGLMFVGHNMIAFDAPLLEMEFRRAGIDFKFEAHEVIDTGALVKAIQLGMYFGLDDTLRNFARRVAEVHARGVFWSLDRYCYDTYDLGRSGIRKDAAHDAANDCILTHCLLETFREKGAACRIS